MLPIGSFIDLRQPADIVHATLWGGGVLRPPPLVTADTANTRHYRYAEFIAFIEARPARHGRVDIYE